MTFGSDIPKFAIFKSKYFPKTRRTHGRKHLHRLSRTHEHGSTNRSRIKPTLQANKLKPNFVGADFRSARVNGF